MNIALFSDTYLPDINGVATSTHILANELRKHNHQVLVVTTNTPDDSDFIDENDSHYHVLRIHGIDIKQLYGYRAANIFSFKGMKELMEFKPDIIHVQTEFGIGIFGKICGEILDVPVCYTYHTMWSDYSHYFSPMPFKAVDGYTKHIIQKVSKIYGESCSALIVPSDKAEEALQSYGINTDIHVVPTGLPIDKFLPENKDEEFVQEIKDTYDLHNKFVFIFLGRIAEEKSIDLLIDCVDKIKNDIKDFKLLVVGGGPQLDELKDLVKSKHLEDLVVFTGPQTSDKVPSFYHASSCFVSASLSETQGLTYIEAMASGIPVIARRDKNLEDVIQDQVNGFFFETNEELIELFKNISTYDLKTVCKNAMDNADQYGSEKFYSRIMNVYNKVLSDHLYCYKVVSISLDKKNMYQVAFGYDNHQVILNLSKQVVERYGLTVGQKVDREELDALKDQEQVSLAYQQALKYLTFKDYTYVGMQKRLMDKGKFDEIQIDMVMDILVQKGLIDDAEYTKSYFEKRLRFGEGVNKIVHSLKKLGIAESIIEDYLVEYKPELEYDKAVEIINKYYTENTSKPQYALIQFIKGKLFNKGFSSEIIDQAINDFNFDMPKEHTLKLLEKEYERVYRRYRTRYDSRLLKSKVITFLVQKGYEYDDVIETVMKLWEDPDDQD